jgi:hypothetical protein
MSHAIKKASVVACYKNHEGAKRTVRKLKKQRFDIKKLSIAGKWFHPCSSLFMISGLGPLSVSGPLVAAIVTALGQRAYIGSLGALTEGLYNIGIPNESIFQYKSALKKGLCLVYAQGPFEKMVELKRVFALSKAIAITVA